MDVELIDAELRRRQGGYGRSGRQRIEKDAVTILSGVRRGQTIGSPVVMEIPNRDFRIDEAPEINRPRPGHADFAGSMKWLTADCRNTLERASARETAARVAAGALAKCLLAEFGVTCVGFVVAVGAVQANVPAEMSPEQLRAARDANEVCTPDAGVFDAMLAAIHAAKVSKDTVGGLLKCGCSAFRRGWGRVRRGRTSWTGG